MGRVGFKGRQVLKIEERRANAVAYILLADDDATQRTILTEILTAAGHEVVQAADGHAATRMMQDPRIELLITDMLMPGKDGIEVITDMKKDGSLIKILAMSSGGKYRSGDVLSWATATGADDVITKPFTPAVLLEKVAAVLGEP